MWLKLNILWATQKIYRTFSTLVAASRERKNGLLKCQTRENFRLGVRLAEAFGAIVTPYEAACGRCDKIVRWSAQVCGMFPRRVKKELVWADGTFNWVQVATPLEVLAILTDFYIGLLNMVFKRYEQFYKNGVRTKTRKTVTFEDR